MLLLIDNYDSFTYNLVHYLGELGVKVVVKRNDALDVQEAMSLGASSILLSPGPCDPAQAGICLALTEAAAAARVPLMGSVWAIKPLGRPLAALWCAAMKLCMAKWAKCIIPARAFSRDCPHHSRPHATIR